MINSQIKKGSRWFRTTPLQPLALQEETWSNGEKEFIIQISHGKPVDILSLKKNMVEDFALSVQTKQRSAANVLTADSTETLTNCPICKSNSTHFTHVLEVYGSHYSQCSTCYHCFLETRLTRTALTNYFKNCSEYRATYNDRTIADTRVTQVAIPKLEWTIEQFKRIYGRPPTGILDVGAGSGHFISACNTFDIPSLGLEISPLARSFAKQIFDVDLLNLDITDDIKNISNFEFELITFWGVIECVSDPLALLKSAEKIIRGRSGMIVAEVPRWHSMSTTIQGTFSSSIIRHLDPIGHLHMFTDDSLMHAFDSTGLSPVSAWYFGMDAFELVTQLAYACNDTNIIEQLASTLPGLQRQLDMFKLSDEIVIAASNQRNT